MGKILFSNKNYSANLSRDDRFYIEDGSSKVSPSGKYLIVNSVSGGTIEFGDGTSKYTEMAYCSVVDMSNGCIVSDWDGEACGYTWTEGKDVLASLKKLVLIFLISILCGLQLLKWKTNFLRLMPEVQVTCSVVMPPP